MSRIKFLSWIVLFIAIAGCSLPPGRPYTRQDIFRTNIFNYFTIKESPDAVLAQLNRDGEVVMEGVDKKNKTYFIKLMSSDKELKATFTEK